MSETHDTPKPRAGQAFDEQTQELRVRLPVSLVGRLEAGAALWGQPRRLALVAALYDGLLALGDMDRGDACTRVADLLADFKKEKTVDSR